MGQQDSMAEHQKVMTVGTQIAYMKPSTVPVPPEHTEAMNVFLSRHVVAPHADARLRALPWEFQKFVISNPISGCQPGQDVTAIVLTRIRDALESKREKIESQARDPPPPPEA